MAEAIASEAGPRGEASPGIAPTPARAGRHRALAVVILLAVLAVFFAPALLTGEQFLYRDNGRMHWPVKQYLAERLRQGQLPEWNPYTSLGSPFVAGAIDGVQHPFSLLLALLPFPVAFKLWDLLSFAIAATGACAWARRLGRTWPASVAAGLGFALSGSLVGASDNLTYLTTLATIPWVFAAAHRSHDRPGPASLALVGLASYLCAAGGDPQAWGIAVALLVVYPLAIQAGAPGWRALARGAQAAAAAVIGAAPIVLPVAAWLSQSSRSDGLDPSELGRWNLPAARLAELVLPFLYRDRPGVVFSDLYTTYGGQGGASSPWVVSVYLGATVVALALVAAARARAARWLLALAALCTWAAMGPTGLLGRGLVHLPIASGFRYWEKMAIWPSLLVPVAAAFGLDAIGAPQARRAIGAPQARRTIAARQGRRAIGALAAGIGVLLVAAQGLGRLWPEALAARLAVPGAPAGVENTLATNLLDGALHAGLVALVLGLAMLAVAAGVVRRLSGPLLAMVVVADVFAANVRGYQLSDPRIVTRRSPFGEYLQGQPGLQRILTPASRLDLGRFAGLRQFEADWLQTSVVLEPCFNVDYRAGNFLPYAGLPPARADRYRRRLLAGEQAAHVGLFGVGWLAVPRSLRAAADVGARPPLDVVMTDPALPAYLLRIPHRERAYLASDVATVDRRGAMEFALRADPAGPPASVVEGPVPAGYRPPAGAARIASDEPERVVVATEADGPALLVLNDIFSSGWTAAVDGRPAEILPANYLARGVWVGGGAHEVEFRYRTPMLREGWALLALAATGLGGVASWRSLRRRR